MKKIGIVVQRFGLEVNGGAEFHARILAEKLRESYDVFVLTTTALHHFNNWKSHYPEGECLVNGIKTIRFRSDPPEHFTPRRKRVVRRIILRKRKYTRFVKLIGLFDYLDKKSKIFDPSKRDVSDWIEMQGPYCPGMLEYLSTSGKDFDCFIFFTYLYYPTVLGMSLVPGKSIFIPTAHDEKLLFTKPYEDIFSVPKYIMYNTASEKELVESRFKKVCKNSDISGVGITEFHLPEGYESKREFDFKYFIYIGRIEEAKGCAVMIDYFNRFSALHPDVKLVIVGKNNMKLKRDKNIVLTGFVEEEEKYFLLKNSLGLVMPSRYESLSMVVLEAMISGKEVVVNAECDVLKQHVEKSGTGFSYAGYEDFSSSLEAILAMDPDMSKRRSEMAIAYVKKNYNWDDVLEKFDKAIRFISDSSATSEKRKSSVGVQHS